MADRRAFVVAIEKPLDTAFGTTPYAETGARALADALAGAGYPKANQVVLLGPHATKAAVESRLRKLRKAVRKGDEVLVYLAGRTRGGVLLCWDTLPDDLPDTGLSLADLVEAVEASKAGQVVCLFDLGADDLADRFTESAKTVALVAAAPGETPHSSATLKASVWAHLITEAVAGRNLKATDGKGRVTTASLQRFIEDELPRTLRKHFEAGAEQHPHLLGEQNAGLVIADLSPLLGGGDGLLDSGRLRRVVFRSDSTGRVKDLSGFRKTYTVPANAGPSNRKFVARIAAADLKADLDAVFEAAREHLGYKRKDVEVDAGGDGFGFLRGPDFEYTVAAALDPADPAQVTWRREVGQFADPGFVRSAGFNAVFGKLFDQLVFEFAAPVDVAALVDRLEDAPPKGARVHVASDGAECDVTLTGFAGRVTVGRSVLTVRGRAGDSAGLLDQFLRFLQTVGPVGEQLALPPS